MSTFIDDLRDLPNLNDLNVGAKRDRGLVTSEEAGNMIDEENDLGGNSGEREVETFPCESCLGTGLYRGPRVHQPKTECFACKGKGYFKKSYKDRMEARAKRAARKQRVADEARQAFATEYPDLFAGMRKHSSWNEFLAKLLADIEAGKTLSEKAIAAAQRTVDKANARDAEREAAKVARLEGAAVVNADQLKKAFDAAAANGLKRPVLRYEDFKVSRAPDNGKNAGALYVKHENGTYLGKIVGDKYVATREAEALGFVAKVVEAMTNPLELAIAYGRRTGQCSCCGRKLTDKTSVANGIGPICADKYGWGGDVAPAGSEEDLAAVTPQGDTPKALKDIYRVNTATGNTMGRMTAKYEYPEGMSADDKRKFRAAARRAAKA